MGENWREMPNLYQLLDRGVRGLVVEWRASDVVVERRIRVRDHVAVSRVI